jgi:hypothetical protein
VGQKSTIIRILQPSFGTKQNSSFEIGRFTRKKMSDIFVCGVFEENLPNFDDGACGALPISGVLKDDEFDFVSRIEMGMVLDFGHVEEKFLSVLQLVREEAVLTCAPNSIFNTQQTHTIPTFIRLTFFSSTNQNTTCPPKRIPSPQLYSFSCSNPPFTASTAARIFFRIARIFTGRPCASN